MALHRRLSIHFDEVHDHPVPLVRNFAVMKMGDVVKDVHLDMLGFCPDHLEEFDADG
jgi:hypothetical protein